VLCIQWGLFSVFGSAPPNLVDRGTAVAESCEESRICERLSHKLMRRDKGRHTSNEYMEREKEKRVLACCRVKPLG
jgi:hypothetical protein